MSTTAPGADQHGMPTGPVPGAVPLLRMEGITKRFPGVVANADVSFDVHRGEVHTLLGENGAGKSTLMKILFGLYQQDEGEVYLDGEVARIASPAEAIDRRIGMIHQHFMLVPTLTVAENVALGLRSNRWPLMDLAAISDRIRELSETYGLRVDPDDEVWKLAVGERQRVEIIKALSRDAELLVLDEPTAVLTPQEVDDLFVTLRQMTVDGRGLIFISHKLHEVLELSDRITVLRDGRVVDTIDGAEATREGLARMMVGREVVATRARRTGDPGPVRLSVRDLHVVGDRGTRAVDGVSLDLHGGEILGVAGVSGNGQRELTEAVAGLRPIVGGTVTVDGADLTGRSSAEVRDAGVAYVPEERMRDGAIGDFTVAENLLLLDHGEEPYSRRGVLQLGTIQRHCRELVARFKVKTPDTSTPISSLSGGNIQKVIMARELFGAPGVVLAAQPTRGVDIGAAEYIHERLVAQRDAGAAILLISEDLDEVMALSDRIAVMFEGRIMGVVDSDTATPAELGLLMAGVTGEQHTT
ncbi:MAG: ABC transporter ATP-binding protein [Actinomycetota bacterium]